MSTRALLSVVFVAVVSWACSSMPIESTLRLGGRSSPSATHLDCAAGNANKKCKVDIIEDCFGAICKFVAGVDEIHLANNNPNIDIVWTLPQGYTFCKQYKSDGGVVLKGTSDDQFNKMYSTDDASGGMPSDPDCKKHRHFHWNAVNSVARPDYGYAYAVYFYSKSGKLYSVDPWVFND
jgi:hypothetical protein